MTSPIDEYCPEDTRNHIYAVQEQMHNAMDNLRHRALRHDRSKCEEPERSGFAAMAEELKLADTEYGSDEYRAILRKYKASTIEHHYAANDHHPEFYDQNAGLAGMSLLSLLEMLCDWKAATLRMKDGDLMRSIQINQERFGYSDTLRAILENTARELGMVVES